VTSAGLGFGDEHQFWHLRLEETCPRWGKRRLVVVYHRCSVPGFLSGRAATAALRAKDLLSEKQQTRRAAGRRLIRLIVGFVQHVRWDLAFTIDHLPIALGLSC